MIVHPYITAANYQANYINYAPCINPLISLLDFIQPCFILKKDTECSELFLEDKTEYDSIDTDSVSINVSLWYSGGVNDEFIQIKDSCPHIVGSRQNYEALCGSGYYKLKINIEYIDSGVTYSFNMEESITLDCCKCDIDDLINEVKSKITNIGCKLHEYECIGKSRVKLNNVLFSLSNILFYLETSDIRNYCPSSVNVECFLKSIKDYC